MAERRENEGAARPAAAGTREAQAAPSRPFPYPLAAAGLVVLLIIITGGYFALRGKGQQSAPTAPPVSIPTQAQVDTSAAIPETGSTATPSPTTEPSQPPEAAATASPEYTVSIIVSRGYLYQGPGLKYPLVQLDPYPRGTDFTVLAMDPSLLWFQTRAPDGKEGWLYLDWVDVNFDRSLAPTAVTTPALPTATRKPPKPPG
jgi:hypothetical protein